MAHGRHGFASAKTQIYTNLFINLTLINWVSALWSFDFAQDDKLGYKKLRLRDFARLITKKSALIRAFALANPCHPCPIPQSCRKKALLNWGSSVKNNTQLAF